VFFPIGADGFLVNGLGADLVFPKRMLIGFFDANRLTIDIFLLPVAGRTKGDRQYIVVDNGSLCGEQQTVGGYIVNGYFMRFIKKLRLPFNIRGSGNLYFGAQAFSSPDFFVLFAFDEFVQNSPKF